MRFKRFTAAAMAAVLAATSTGIYAYAAEDAAMKTALTYVKERFTIPENYSTFTYSTSTSMGKTQYQFRWQDPNDIEYGSSIQVNIVGRVIKNVRIYDKNTYNWDRSFAKMSDEKLIAAAKKYINALNPTITAQTEILDDTFRINLAGNVASLRFRRAVNGIPVTGQTGYVNINKNTGELMEYSYNWIPGATFSTADGAITLDAAKKAYRKNFDSELVYTIAYKWDEETFKRVEEPHLIYSQTNSGQINAFTGEISTFKDYGYYDNGDDVMEEAEFDEADDANPATGGVDNTVTFTKEEIEKLEKEGSMPSAEQSLAELKKLGIFFLPDSVEVDSQNLYFDDDSGYYIRNVSFTSKYEDFIDLNNEEIIPRPANVNSDRKVSGSFSIRPETGELLSFYNYNADTGDDLSDAKARAKATSALKKLLGDKYSKFGVMEQKSESAIAERFDKETGDVIPGTPRTTKRNYSANRVEYDIKCREEYYSISVSNNGYISDYNVNYNEKVQYPKPDNIIKKGAAYTKFFEQVPYALKYRCAYDTKEKKVVTALVYAADNTVQIDAFTGKMTNWDGSELPAVTEDGDYTDLEGSKYAAYAKKLASYGVKLMDENGKLNEDQAITGSDFSALLMRSVGLYYYFNNTRYDDSEELTFAQKLKGSTKLRRRTAAMMLVSASLGGRNIEKVAELPGIYKSSFSDVKDSDAYVGYIEIANAAGLLTGTKDKFYPKAAFTRGAAIKLVYDILNK